MIKNWGNNIEDFDLVSDIVEDNLMDKNLPFRFVRNIIVSIIENAKIIHHSQEFCCQNYRKCEKSIISLITHLCPCYTSALEMRK